jgi:hypothetical protein
MIKYILLFCFIQTSLIAQQRLDFLKGTWKTFDNKTYEHWDQLDSNHFKGFSYYFKGSQMVVTEYLEIQIINNQFLYQASVIGANFGKIISFEKIKNDSALIFENLNHDFPQRISYEFTNKDMILINLSGINNKMFQYKLIRKY